MSKADECGTVKVSHHNVMLTLGNLHKLKGSSGHGLETTNVQDSEREEKAKTFAAHFNSCFTP